MPLSDKYLTFIMVTISAMLSSCETPQISKSAPDINHLEKERKYVLKLPEDHRTGYLWRMEPTDGNYIKQKSSVWHGNDKGIYFYFMTGSVVGQSTITLHHVKYRDTAETKQYIVNINDN